MHHFKLATLVAVLCLAWTSSSEARCPPWRPCGMGNSWGGNRLISQGAFGADFRPACANHDACLRSGAPACFCDQQYLAEMSAACACSSNPQACQRKAQRYYNAVRFAHSLFRR